MKTLRARLLLMMAILIVMALGVVGVLSSRVTREEMRRMSLEQDAGQALRAADVLAQCCAAEAGWSRAGAALAPIAGTTHDFVVTGPDRNVLALSDDLLPTDFQIRHDGSLVLDRARGGVRLRIILDRPQAPVVDRDGGAIAFLYWFRRPDEQPPSMEPAARIDRWLVAIFIAAAAASALVAWAIARRLTGPVERLTAAARRMEAGDLTVRVDAGSPDEIGELSHAFNAMAESISRNEVLRRRLVGDVAHELRTPLTNIIGQLEAIQDGLVAPSRGTIDSLHADATHLAALVKDLQELALAESGALKLRREPLELGSVVRQAVAASAAAATARGITLDAEVLAPVGAEADETRLLQTIRNLIENALVHTPAGGRVTVRLTSAGGEALVSVADTGIGIPPPELGKIFERFYRLDPSRSRSTGGTGLGLAIVRQLVEAHGGRVWAESEGEAKGSVFTFSLPLASASS